MLPNTILEVTEENTKHFKCVSIPMFMQIMQMSLRVSHSLHLPYACSIGYSVRRGKVKEFSQLFLFFPIFPSFTRFLLFSLCSRFLAIFSLSRAKGGGHSAPLTPQYVATPLYACLV